ncbi:MAG: T9SS type A sorting domain-containing protein [Bacteroidales bacterium]|nr:T9SS type A sorting domain-containing protein [Bacteroidales bacterium]
MRNLLLITFISILSLTNMFSQALPIAIDGRYNDWGGAASFEDTQNDGSNIDLLSFSVSNDSSYLFIRIALSEEIELDYNNNLYLEIDADNNASTGYPVNGIGADLAINFGDKTFIYNAPDGSTSYLSHYDIGFYELPTVTSDTFEFAINRFAMPDGTNLLFNNPVIDICFIENISGGDKMPNSGTIFSYTFDETPVETYNYIGFEKNNESDVRLMTYNTLYDGLISSNTQRVAAFQRIITAVNPDIITFNECWSTTKYQAQNLLNSWLPVSGGQWTCIKADEGNITCSKYNIPDYYTIDPTYINRITANLVDLPDTYPRDILVINSHFKCCSDDNTRQSQADAIISFIRDVKSSGGGITLPYGTPFVISGDLNLVGSSRQLKTLLTGDILNNYEFGEDISPDWDNTNLTDIIGFHTDERTALTWLDNTSSYWPGRIDYTISSDEGSSVSKTFIVNTKKMLPERLSQYSLLISDSELASDHFPKITDFIIEDAIENVSDLKDFEGINIYPNPSSSGLFTIDTRNNTEINKIQVFNITGQNIFSSENNKGKNFKLDLSSFNSGIYFIEISTKTFTGTYKVVK